MAEMQDSRSEKKIQVAIRVRPVIDSENGKEEFWEVQNPTTIRRKDSRNELKFDRVFGGNESNFDVYNAICKPIIKEVIRGFNATIFAYGQTSSGKTFTMMGDDVLQGVIHYAIEEIFQMIQDMTDREFLLRVSVLEIYNEKVYDLLSGKSDLKLMDDCYGVLKICGLEERIVQTAEQIWNVMREGQAKRRTGETQMNRASSRSHFIFRMILESSVKGEEDPIVSVSQLNLVDLAGSENVDKTKTEGIAFKEGSHINRSLTALSLVISQLSEKSETVMNLKPNEAREGLKVHKPKSQFITYRNTKLTRILQSSLGGNALTAIICTVTPISLHETQSTLSFALNAIKIKNKPHKNEVLTDQALLKRYANEIKKLSEELKATKEQGELELEDTKKQNENLKKQIEKLKANFVCQSPQENQMKAVRRATLCGLPDRKKFFNSRNTALNSRFMQNLQLPNIYEEEIEGESDFPDLMDSIMHRNSRGTSRLSTSSCVSTCLSKSIQKDVGVQTCSEFLEESSDIDELMTMVFDLKSQLRTLQREFAEHNEYTTLEKQILKAEHELQVENEELRAENIILKRKLESKQLIDKSHLSCNESKESENTNKNETLENNKDCTLNLGMFNNNLVSKNFNSSHISEKCDFNKSVKEINKMNISDSTLLDDSHEQSKFLAFYDEFMENDLISKLKSEIEVLKHDIEIKNKKSILLNDEILIKEQFISSLKDEIALNKNTDLHGNMKDKTAQVHEACQTSFIQMSPVRSVNTEASSNINMEDKFTEVTPIKSREHSTQYCRYEVVDEHCVQTSPIRDLICFSQCISNEKLKSDQYSQISDSFTERTSISYSNESKRTKQFHQSSQTSNFSNIDDEDFIDNVFVTNKERNICGCGYFSDETKVLIKKVSELMHSASNICKSCTKIEYLKDVDKYLSDVDDNCSKSALEKIIDLENLLSAFGYYISNRDQDCEAINNQLESKVQEINLLDSELSSVKETLNIRESELSSLRNLFLDLKQNFSHLTFLSQILNSVDSEEKYTEMKERASRTIPLESNSLECEMIMFKNNFVKLNSYMEENASKIISLSEELKKVKSELAAVQREGLKSFENSCVLRNTLSKSVQTSQDLSIADAAEKDRLLLESNDEKNTLLERIKYLEQTNNNLRKDMDDISNSYSEKIETLEKDITNMAAIKTEMLVKDLEQKYDQELIDQEKHYAEELRVKTLAIKQENIRQLNELQEKIQKMELSHSAELSAIKKQYEDQLASLQSEKQQLKRELENEHENKINTFKEKYIAKQKEFRKIYSDLNVRMQHYMEEIEKLKKENTPSNQLLVIENLKAKINDLSNARDMLQKAELQISELKENNNYLKHELKRINETEHRQSVLNKMSKLEETNKELLYDLDQKKAKIMSLQSNNASMLQELKKLKEMQSSKVAVSCKCKSNSKEPTLDMPEKNEDKKERKNKMNSKDVSDDKEKMNPKQRSIDENSTPQQNEFLNNMTPDQNAALCAGGGSGPANMVINYWLERQLQKKDKEIGKLREEIADLKSQLKREKLLPFRINEEKQPEIKEIRKPDVVKPSISPLREVDENVTVQLKSAHPYPEGTVPKIPKKHPSREKNTLIADKPYNRHTNRERTKKENFAFDWQRPVNSNENKSEPTKYDVVKQLADPECNQQ